MFFYGKQSLGDKPKSLFINHDDKRLGCAYKGRARRRSQSSNRLGWRSGPISFYRMIARFSIKRLVKCLRLGEFWPTLMSNLTGGID
jgi:hypothetical protein